jgi:hypothetical protein
MDKSSVQTIGTTKQVNSRSCLCDRETAVQLTTEPGLINSSVPVL